MKNTAEILTKYEPLVSKMAGKFRWSGLDHEELRQTARLGILKALTSYDEEKGALTTHLQYGALGELTDLTRKSTHAISQSNKLRKLYPSIKRAMRDSGLNGAEARYAAAQTLRRPVSDIDAVLAAMAPSAGSDSLELMSAEVEELSIESGDRWTMLTHAMSSLSDIEREVIIARDIEGKTWDDVSEAIGFSNVTARKRHKSAMAMLRKSMKGVAFSDLF